MCLADLYDFDPEQRAAIVRLEDMRRMREVTLAWRNHYQSMPAASVETTPCVEAVAAGSLMEVAI